MLNEAERTPELIFEEFEEDTHTRYPHQRAEKIKDAIPLLEAQGRDTEKQQAIWENALALLHVRDSPEERKQLGGRFGPMAEFDGRIQIPDPAIFTDDALVYYAMRAEQTSNPIHRARYCDFIWEKQRDHKFARKAIDAYLECLPIYVANGWANEVADSISRATELALTLNDTKRVEKVKDHILETLDKLVSIGGHPPLRYCLDLIDAILEMKERASESDLQKALDICRKGAAFYASESGGFMYYLARSFEERQTLLWQRVGDGAEADNARVRIGELFEKEAELRGGASNMIGAAILEQAVQHYANIGRSERVEELKIKVKQKWQAAIEGGEFKRIEIPVEIPKEHIHEYAQDILSRGVEEALLAVSLDMNLVPDIEECRKLAVELKQKYPMQGLLPQSRLRGARQVASSGTQEEIDEANALSQYAIDLGFRQVYLRTVFGMALREGVLTPETFVTYLSHGPFFDEDKLEVIRIGVDRCFAGDYVSAVHILVPHLEDILRGIIGKLGVSTTSRGSDGFTRAKPLDVILNTPELKRLLGDRVWFYFKYVLDHQLGENLRNDVAHGLMDRNSCTAELTVTVLHLVLRLSPYRVRNEVPNTQLETDP